MTDGTREPLGPTAISRALSVAAIWMFILNTRPLPIPRWADCRPPAPLRITDLVKIGHEPREYLRDRRTQHVPSQTHDESLTPKYLSTHARILHHRCQLAINISSPRRAIITSAPAEDPASPGKHWNVK